MKNHLIILLLPFIAFGCATGKPAIKATAPNTEVVTAEGSAPVINNDVTGAKKTSLHDALKNALGLVVGVYVSQEALVSKAMLIEDNITSQTEGYIEKYDVLKEGRDGEFYRTTVRALVRKEDLSAKIKALDLEPKRLGNPVVRISVEEFVDGAPAPSPYASGELKKRFTDKGFIVSDQGDADILVAGRAESTYNTSAGLGGLVSYRATVAVSVTLKGSGDLVANVQETLGGVDAEKNAAAKAALVNASQKIGRDLPDNVLKFLRERSSVQLTVSNVGDLNELNGFIRSVRALIEVRDCRVRHFADNTAALDMDLKKGGAADVARRLEQMDSFRTRVTKTGAYSIEAEMVK